MAFLVLCASPWWLMMSSIFIPIGHLEITFCEGPIFSFEVSAFLLLVCKSSLYMLDMWWHQGHLHSSPSGPSGPSGHLHHTDAPWLCCWPSGHTPLWPTDSTGHQSATTWFLWPLQGDTLERHKYPEQNHCTPHRERPSTICIYLPGKR